MLLIWCDQPIWLYFYIYFSLSEYDVNRNFCHTPRQVFYPSLSIFFIYHFGFTSNLGSRVLGQQNADTEISHICALHSFTFLRLKSLIYLIYPLYLLSCCEATMLIPEPPCRLYVLLKSTNFFVCLEWRKIWSQNFYFGDWRKDILNWHSNDKIQISIYCLILKWSLVYQYKKYIILKNKILNFLLSFYHLSVHWILTFIVTITCTISKLKNMNIA